MTREIIQVPNTGTRHNIFPKYQISVGPWVGGLNSSNDRTLISSSELAESVNFIHQNDGRMRIRPQARREYPDSIFWGIDPTVTRIQALGSTPLVNENITPLIARFGLPVIAGGDGKITFWRYGGDGTLPTENAQWHESFEELDWPITPDEVWHIPIQVLLYDKQYFVLFNKLGFLVGTDGIGDPLDTSVNMMGPPKLHGSPPADTTFIRKAVILKDRILLHSDKDVYWSTANPTGVADDWSSTAPNTAGFLGINREITHDKVHDIIVYQNELYILGSTTISKLSWNTDPNIDGEFVVIAAHMGGQTFAVVNGDLFVFTGFGLYRLVTSYFTEVSGSVRDFIRDSCRGMPNELPTLNAADAWDERPVVGMYHLDNLLLIGPLNGGAAQRYDDVSTNNYACNVFLVFNVDTGAWTKWQFSPNCSDEYPIAGPSQNWIMTQRINDPAFVDNYVWVGRTLVDGALATGGVYGQAIYSMQAVANLLTDALPVGYDDAGPVSDGSMSHVNRPIGLIFITCQIDLGDVETDKRILTTLIDAASCNPPTLTQGAVTLGYVLDNPTNDNIDRYINLAVPQIDRLPFGGMYRAKRFGFRYDSLTGIAAIVANVADIDLVKKISFYITLSRKDVAGRV